MVERDSDLVDITEEFHLDLDSRIRFASEKVGVEIEDINNKYDRAEVMFSNNELGVSSQVLRKVASEMIFLLTNSNRTIKLLLPEEALDPTMDLSALKGIQPNLSIDALDSKTSIAQHISRLKQIGKTEGIEEITIPFANKFALMDAGELCLAIGSVALKDFLDFKPKFDSPVPYFNFLVLGFLYDSLALDKEILDGNETTPFRDYPNCALSTRLMLKTSLGIIGDELEFQRTRRGSSRSKLVDAVSHVIRTTQDLLFDPQSPYFPTLKNKLTYYFMSGDKDMQNMALLWLGLTHSQFSEIYRKSQKFIREGNNVSFYQMVSDATKEFIADRNFSETMDIFTKDDVPEVMDFEKLTFKDSFQRATFDLLGKLAGSIAGKSSKRGYFVEPNSINWGNVSVPEKVFVRLDQNRPKRFKIFLLFHNNLEDSMVLSYALNTEKQTFDWDLLENPMIPEDTDLLYFRDSLMGITINLLEVIDADLEPRIKTRLVNPQQNISTRSGDKRVRASDESYDLRKEMKEEQKKRGKQGSFFTNVLTPNIEKTSRVNNLIVMPNEGELSDILKYLSSVDAQIIRDTLREYNEKGIGARLKRLKTLGIDGTHRFSLAINCTVPKGARVLLKEESSSKGIRSFIIVDARYRKDIYRANNL